MFVQVQYECVSVNETGNIGPDLLCGQKKQKTKENDQDK